MIIYPFNSPEFIDHWNLYKQFRKEEHKFKYRSEISEQAALRKIGRLSNNDEYTAIEIINQSLENNWKGLFALKKQNNEPINQNRFKSIMSSISNR